jgi:hypothetical protein
MYFRENNFMGAIMAIKKEKINITLLFMSMILIIYIFVKINSIFIIMSSKNKKIIPIFFYCFYK